MEMTLDEARRFIASVPWRQVQDRVYTDTPVHARPDPHQYVVESWAEVDRDQLWAFAQLIKELGYRGRYSAPYNPDRSYVYRYFRVDAWVYWHMGKLINRCPAEHRQHEVLPEQGELPIEGSNDE
jgi:hypothetical protein